MLLTGCLVHFRVQTLGDIWFAGRLVAADMIDRPLAKTSGFRPKNGSSSASVVHVVAS